VSNNFFFGEIPPNIVGLENLEVLELDGNYLHGTLPADMNKMTRLTTLCFNDNYFSASPSTMPDFSSMPMLRTFGFYVDPKDGGKIPTALLPQGAWVFKLSMNAPPVPQDDDYNPNPPSPDPAIDCNVPDVSGMPISTQALAFTAGFSGDTIREGLFDEILTLENLVILSFSDYEVELGANNQDPWIYKPRENSNRFPAPVPAAMSKLKNKLVMLSLHGCTIVEEGLPVALKDFTKLTALYLGRNNFTGTIDATDFKWNNLHTIDLSYNQFTGGWPYKLFADDFYWENIDISNNPLLGAEESNGAISGQLCQYFESKYHTQDNNKFVLQELSLDNTGFACYDPCYDKKEKEAPKYGYNVIFPEDAKACNLTDQLFALHDIYDDLILVALLMVIQPVLIEALLVMRMVTLQKLICLLPPLKDTYH
jgi:hypothetical protein